MIALSPAGLQAEAATIEALAKTTTEWVRLRTEAARLEGEWTARRDLMEATVQGLEHRALTAELTRDNLLAKSATDRRELTDLEAKNLAASDGLLVSESRTKLLQERLVRLRPSLPPRLSSSLELLYLSMADPALPAGERMQTTMAILNRCLLFNRSVSCGEEAVQPPGETRPRVLTVIYWGLSRGYALEASAKKAWLGSPGPDGWRWEEKSEAAADVAALIAVCQEKADPAFAIVPASLLHPATAATQP